MLQATTSAKQQTAGPDSRAFAQRSHPENAFDTQPLPVPALAALPNLIHTGGRQPSTHFADRACTTPARVPSAAEAHLSVSEMSGSQTVDGLYLRVTCIQRK